MQKKEESATAVGEDEIQFITPDAFTINQNLIGTPLARPWKRFLAFGIDGVFLSILSSFNPVFLALVLGVLFFYVGSDKRKTGIVFPEVFSARRRKWIRRLFWLSGLTILAGSLVTLFAVFMNADKFIFEESDGWKIEQLISIRKSVYEYNDRIVEASCQNPECVEDLLEELRQDLKKHGFSSQVEEGIMEGLKERIKAVAQVANSVPDENPNIPAELPFEAIEDVLTAVEESQSSPSDSSYSIVEWSKGLMNDLGLGIGWSSLYFTLFVSWWKGQTPGKKLLRIRIVQLDATPITLWESFGRYGGYAAGFSTGLLGFFQVLWDSNRQAIQDKISATVVVDLSNPKRENKASGE